MRRRSTPSSGPTIAPSSVSTSEPSADAAGADKSEPAGAPITSRQKKLLAQLVEEHPRLARELGVNPDEPGLEKLGKAKAGLLIQAVLDRVNPQAPPDER